MENEAKESFIYDEVRPGSDPYGGIEPREIEPGDVIYHFRRDHPTFVRRCGLSSERSDIGKTAIFLGSLLPGFSRAAMRRLAACMLEDPDLAARAVRVARALVGTHAEAAVSGASMEAAIMYSRVTVLPDPLQSVSYKRKRGHDNA